MYVIYSKPNCSYCIKAKHLLESKGLEYTELVLDVGQEKNSGSSYYTVNQLRDLVPNVKTVPQIFFDNKLIGGFEDLKTSLSV